MYCTPNLSKKKKKISIDTVRAATGIYMDPRHISLKLMLELRSIRVVNLSQSRGSSSHLISGVDVSFVSHILGALLLLSSAASVCTTFHLMLITRAT